MLCLVSGKELLERVFFWGPSFVGALEYVICLNFFVLHFWLGDYFWKVEFPFWSFLLQRVPLSLKYCVAISIGDKGLLDEDTYYPTFSYLIIQFFPNLLKEGL